MLPNGLRLIYQDHRASDIVAVYLWVGVGVRYEKPDELGYAHFQEHMLFKGTDKWGPGYIDRAVEGVGGRSNAVTSFDYTTFYIVVPRESTDAAIELLHDMAFRSAFDPAEIGREREVIFEEARIEADNPRTAIVRQLYGMVFEGHPYGRPVLGIPETMNKATREQLRAFNQHYYTPENMSLVVVGPVDERAVRATVDRTFGRVPRRGYTPPPVPAPRPLTGVVRRDVERPEQQALLALGWPAPRSDDPDGFAVDLLASILAGTESSRLARRLRDEERLVTGVNMSYAALVAGGIVSLRAELEAKDLARAEQIILEELAKIQESGPTEEERRARGDQVRVRARLLGRDLRGPRQRLRHRGDDVDARGGAALRGPPPPGHPRADPRRRPALPLAHRLRATGLPAAPGDPVAMRRRDFLAGLGGLAAWLAAASARAGAQAVARTRLPNGLTLLVRENPTAPVVAMSLIARMGTRWETRADAGISNLVQLMVVRGTQRLDGGQIVEAADRMGGSIDAYGDVDASEIPATALSRHAAEMLDLVADVALAPTIPHGHHRTPCATSSSTRSAIAATSPTTWRWTPCSRGSTAPMATRGLPPAGARAWSGWIATPSSRTTGASTCPGSCSSR